MPSDEHRIKFESLEEERKIEFETLEDGSSAAEQHETAAEPGSDFPGLSGGLPRMEEKKDDSERRTPRSRASSRAAGRDGSGSGSGSSASGSAVRLIVILLILGIAAAVGWKVYDAKKKARLAAEEAASIEASIAAEEASRAAEKKYEITEFEPCGIPELSMLAVEYFDARMACDTDRLYEMFRRNKPSSDDELAVRLKVQADWIQGYNNISVYTAPGLDDSAKLCLVLYDIDFRRTDTPAPGVMYFYAVRDADGNYSFLDNPVKEIYDYIQDELSSESAQKLITESNAKLKEALDSDSTLALIYTYFKSGEIYRQNDIDTDREQEVGLFLDPEDSILVEDDVLEAIRNEAAEEASIEASMAAEDETQP